MPWMEETLMNDDLVTSKEIIERTKISRATLNNYIKYGLLPRPLVRIPSKSHEGPTKIGYFPRWVIQKVRDVQRMKREGKTMDEITRLLSQGATVPNVDAALYDPSRMDSSSEADGIQPVLDPKMPSFFSLCVLAVDFQDSFRIRTELPADEYFELINRVYRDAGQIFTSYGGLRGKYPGDGLLCYFLGKPRENYIMNALKCAFEVLEIMKRISKEWQLLKGWFHEIAMNVGFDEGIGYLGTVRAEHNVEIVGVGDCIDQAVCLSELGRNGTVFATKGLVNRLADAGRNAILYGVRRTHPERGEIFVEKSFSRILDVVDAEHANRKRFTNMGNCLVTQIVSIKGFEV
jgi:class 3 adenylate cyclase